mgnify:CR=1 FL=1
MNYKLKSKNKLLFFIKIIWMALLYCIITFSDWCKHDVRKLIIKKGTKNFLNNSIDNSGVMGTYSIKRRDICCNI